MFITFEGIDYSGKSTQIKKIIDYFEQNNIKYCLVREPGGTIISEKIREILLDKQFNNIFPETELLLFSSARAQLVREVIKPKLSEGYIVLGDRFFDSTFAYQGYGHGLSLKYIEKITNFATDNLKPDLTFIFDIPLEVAKERANLNKRAKDRIENFDEKFFYKVRNGYIKISNTDKRYKIIDATEPIDEIFKKIIEIILQNQKKWKSQ